MPLLASHGRQGWPCPGTQQPMMRGARLLSIVFKLAAKTLLAAKPLLRPLVAPTAMTPAMTKMFQDLPS